jgi:hypothetical protein
LQNNCIIHIEEFPLQGSEKKNEFQDEKGKEKD